MQASGDVRRRTSARTATPMATSHESLTIQEMICIERRRRSGEREVGVRGRRETQAASRGAGGRTPRTTHVRELGRREDPVQLAREVRRRLLAREVLPRRHVGVVAVGVVHAARRGLPAARRRLGGSRLRRSRGGRQGRRGRSHGRGVRRGSGSGRGRQRHRRQFRRGGGFR